MIKQKNVIVINSKGGIKKLYRNDLTGGIGIFIKSKSTSFKINGWYNITFLDKSGKYVDGKFEVFILNKSLLYFSSTFGVKPTYGKNLYFHIDNYNDYSNLFSKEEVEKLVKLGAFI